ncbi:hypothetical protein H0H93_002479, partial [Arthromyces matolae]
THHHEQPRQLSQPTHIFLTSFDTSHIISSSMDHLIPKPPNPKPKPLKLSKLLASTARPSDQRQNPLEQSIKSFPLEITPQHRPIH